MLFNIFITCILVGFMIWYYFVKNQEKDQKYSNLHSEYIGLCNENQKLKSRLKDLQSYKNDVSKTFKILDNELLLINDRLQNRDSHLNTPQPNPISVLTPELLTSLFNNMNQEFADYTNYENQEPIEELNNDTQLASLKENEFINTIENANVDPTNLPSKEDYSQYLIDN
jgi:predicted nuclease with TOPRIM domain